MTLRILPDRVFLTVMDSVGVGELPDADKYGDCGSDTVGNISRRVPLKLPTLRSLGLPRVARVEGMAPIDRPLGAFGRMAEQSAGKDSVTGHWEMSGIILGHAFPTFPEGFPADVIAEFEQRIGRKTIGNYAASGTVIIDQLGAEHMRTGFPIVYTSADSVFQIAAHEEVIPLKELYRICEIAYELVGRGMNVGRVIARPFVGTPGAFTRTANRHDYALPPSGTTLLDAMTAAGKTVHAIGKIKDLFAGRGVTTSVHTKSDDEGVNAIERAIASAGPGLVFTNLVDFDTQYGHRNDPAGYAANLERFDERLAHLLPTLRERDLLIITADHGNDPTTASTDHAREYVPVFAVGKMVKSGVDLGTRATFADLGQTVAEIFGVGPLAHGTSFLRDILT
ncbi:MAG TPA: phosphopentomutase [Vicinamibacterales bacterium]|jgi:phosphopentomutase|nr:phosphopentomutase [Vicinamibacterales bacterium]